MIRWKCIRECIWQGRHWKSGEIYEGAETPPDHFRIIQAAEQAAEASEADGPRRGRKTKKDDRDDRDDSGERGKITDDGP